MATKAVELPHLDKAIVEQRKITEYLLSLEHAEGSSKAEFFRRFGFEVSNWEALANAVLEHARANLVTSAVETEFGTKYGVEGPLLCPDGRLPLIRSVWIIDIGSDVPRLVTAHPL